MDPSVVISTTTINANTHIQSKAASLHARFPDTALPPTASGPPPRYDTTSIKRLGGEGHLALNLAGETN